MRIIIALILLLLAGCTTTPITSTSVVPPATDASNALMCLIRAQNGDCAAPCPMPTATMGTACAYLPDATTTLGALPPALEGCALAAGQQPIVAAVSGIQTTICAKAGKVIGTGTTAATPVVTIVPAAKP